MKSITEVVQNLLKPYIDGKDNNIYEVMGKNGAKNLFYFDIDKVKAANTAGVWNGLTYTINGVAFTINDDGTVTANGTASSSAYLYLSLRGTKMFALPVGKYIETGSPSVGCQIEMTYTDSNNARQTIGTETGEGQAFEVTAAMISSYFDIGFNLYVIKDETVSNVVFYPMIRLASDTDSTYQPYSKTNQQLTAENEALTNNLANEVSARAELGAHNILDVNINKIKSWNTTGTWSGNTYTIQDMTFDFEVDGKNNVTKITANRAQVGTGNIFLKIASFDSGNYNLIPNTEYIISGCPSGGSVNSYMLYATNGGSTLNDTRDTGNGAKFSAPTLSSNFEIYIMVLSTVTMTNKEFYPMICLATDSDLTFAPYAKTNQELTAENQTLTNNTYNVNDTAITEVASDDLLPIYDTSAAAKKKIAVSNFVGGLVSNPNLLDNPWFTVNQRGQSSYSDAGYTVDRWIRNAGDANGHKITLGIIELPLNKSDVYQPILDADCHLEANQKYTMSAIIDGTVYSHTFTAYGDGASHFHSSLGIVDNIVFNIIENWDTTLKKHLFGINNYSATQDHVITAIKLEKGSVSTLANDTAPNYQQELAKCQRYCAVYGTSASGYGALTIGVARDASSVRCDFTFPVPMRANPSVLFTSDDTSKIGMMFWHNGAKYEMTPNENRISYNSNSLSCNVAQIMIDATNLVSLQAGMPVELWLTKSDSDINTHPKLIFSADL